MKIQFHHPPKYGRRIILMLLGVLVQGFGLSLLIRIQMGTDPCSSFTQGVANYIPFSFGTCQLLCHLVNFLFVIRYDRSFIGWGTVGNMVFLGYIADGFTYLYDTLAPSEFGKQGMHVYLLLVIGLCALMVGAATYMSAGIGSSPYDALPFIIADHVKKLPFKYVRMLWDIAFMVAGLLLGGDVGIVTVAVAFFVGPVISKIKDFVTKRFLS